MTTNKNEVIALAVANNSVATVTEDLFKDIDFSGISQAIENIGNHNGGLTTEEKEMANTIVDQWEQDVIERLHGKNYEMRDFVNFFETGSDGYVNGNDKLEDFGYDLADKTKTMNEYNALIKLIEELEELQQDRPEAPIEREERTYKEKLEEERKYHLESARYSLAVTKLNRAIYKAEYEWKKLLKQNKEVKELIKNARKYTKDVDKFRQLCHDKSQVAKLNITVANDDIRQSLRDLLNFKTTI